ncbi:M50 family metallopeptidase [Gleimia hominis]|uniref:M50 family metallopeptidase n=1 Tax=Gleimia hominis TaxID=595468 RepID=UPI000C80A011|nr:site-2 protease family protein [Gleimia hominis]WIK65297.1 site-2 protease family protein [Gleimia hominis]
MGYLLGIVLAIVALILSVALHELGHLLPAKKFGVYVPQYMVGFGPTLWSKKRGDTEYGVKAILLGGYVRLAGMFAPAREGVRTHKADGRPTLAQEAREASAEELPAGREPQAFYNLSVPKKLVVMLGGPTVNLVMSIVLIAIVMMGIGVQQPVTKLAQVPQCLGQCEQGAPKSPAYEAGLRAGDTVVAWDGHRVDTWPQLVEQITASGSRAVPVQVQREGKTKSYTVAPKAVNGQAKAGIVAGFERRRASVVDVADASWHTFTATASVVLRLPKAVWDTTVGLFQDRPRDPNSVLSVVGVGRLAGEVSADTNPQVTVWDRAGVLLSLWGSLNMALFVFNLIPLPPLDGGHVAGALWEGARRTYNRMRRKPDPGPADTARLMPLTYTMVLVFAVMTLVLIAADIINPIHLLR